MRDIVSQFPDYKVRDDTPMAEIANLLFMIVDPSTGTRYKISFLELKDMMKLAWGLKEANKPRIPRPKANPPHKLPRWS